jgi:hypothetical protein
MVKSRSKDDTNDKRLNKLRSGSAAVDESSAFAELSAKREDRGVANSVDCVGGAIRLILTEARPEAMK